MKLLRPAACPEEARSAYRIAHRLPRDCGFVHLHPIGLREHLPELQVPLRRGDATVRVELQPLLTRVYDSGRYGLRLNYKQPLTVPLPPEEEAWAHALLLASGKLS